MNFTTTKTAIIACLLTGTATTAWAQDNICGGVGAGGQWIGGSAEGSDIATSPDYLEEMALVLAGSEHFSIFSLSAPSSVRVEAQGRGAGDPLFDLLDNDGNIIVSDDDSGGNGASRAEIELDAGTYCVAMSSFDGGPMTAFVRVGLTSHEPLTEGVSAGGGSTAIDGSCAEAPDLGTLEGPLSASGSADSAPFWRFTLPTDMPISITANNEAADPVITLYDIDENYITENDDADGLNSRIDWPDRLAAGDYCINVTALSDTSLPIDIEVSEYDPEAALAALYAQGEASPPMDGSVPIKDLGAIQGRVREDAQISDRATWYSVNMDQAGLLVVEAISADGTGDPWVAIFDDLGRRLTVNDDHGDSYDSFAAARVQNGTYLVAVKEVSPGTQSFVRLVFERFVPAGN